jgi:hypothetical protein
METTLSLLREQRFSQPFTDNGHLFLTLGGRVSAGYHVNISTIRYVGIDISPCSGFLSQCASFAKSKLNMPKFRRFSCVGNYFYIYSINLCLVTGYVMLDYINSVYSIVAVLNLIRASKIRTNTAEGLHGIVGGVMHDEERLKYEVTLP